MESLDDLIEDKVKEKLNLYNTDSRRSQNQIRDMIQQELEKRPKTRHEIMKAINTTKQTTDRNLQHLQEIDVVESFETEETTYWKLKNELQKN